MKKSEQYRVITIGMLLILVFATGNDFVEKVSTIFIEENTEYKMRADVKDTSRKIQKLIDTEGEIFLLGKISAEESKCLMYELNGQYEWNRDCYKMVIRGDSTIYRNAVKYPSVLEIYDYEYIWCYGDNNEKYDRLKYYCGLQSMNDGDFYKLSFDHGKVEAVWLGNIKE